MRINSDRNLCVTGSARRALRLTQGLVLPGRFLRDYRDPDRSAPAVSPRIFVRNQHPSGDKRSTSTDQVTPTPFTEREALQNSEDIDSTGRSSLTGIAIPSAAPWFLGNTFRKMKDRACGLSAYRLCNENQSVLCLWRKRGKPNLARWLVGSADNQRRRMLCALAELARPAARAGKL